MGKPAAVVHKSYMGTSGEEAILRTGVSLIGKTLTRLVKELASTCYG